MLNGGSRRPRPLQGILQNELQLPEAAICLSARPSICLLTVKLNYKHLFTHVSEKYI